MPRRLESEPHSWIVYLRTPDEVFSLGRVEGTLDEAIAFGKARAFEIWGRCVGAVPLGKEVPGIRTIKTVWGIPRLEEPKCKKP